MSATSKAATAKAERVARERARRYEARRAFYERGVRRRRIDDLVFGIGALVLVAGAITSQTVYATSGPGSVVPTPEPTIVQSDVPTAPTTPQEILPTLIPLPGTDG